MSRDWDGPEYRSWRRAVRKRDGHRCRQCGGRKRLQCHHVRRWADAPELRFDVANGITLCKACHDRLSGREDEVSPALTQLIIHPKSAAEIMVLRYARPQEEPPTPEGETPGAA